jgi:hypothetical protein
MEATIVTKTIIENSATCNNVRFFLTLTMIDVDAAIIIIPTTDHASGLTKAP